MTTIKTRVRTTARAFPLLAATALAGSVAAGADEPGLSLSVIDADTDRTIRTVGTSETIEVPAGADLVLRATPDPGWRADRVRFSAMANPDSGCRMDGGASKHTDANPPFEVRVAQGDAGRCRWMAVAYSTRTKQARAIIANLKAGAAQPDPGHDPGHTPRSDPEQDRRYDLTRGTSARSHLTLGPKQARAMHGVRVFCVVSHLSYDDPVVFPGREDAAHLHVFLGNTSTDAHSTPASLRRANSSSCEGGTSMRSAYWMPALLDARGQAVLPERFVTYYKTFLPGGTPDELPRGTIRPIPDGLEMLSGRTALNFDANTSARNQVTRDSGRLKLTMRFPQCVAVHPNGRPVLSHRDMPGAASERVNSHMAYAVWASGSRTGCPGSHPYRIPGVAYLAWYDVPVGARWSLSSDTDASNPGHSLHADYVSAWDGADMARLVRCNEEGRSCVFEGGIRQHPDRFDDADGRSVYINSVLLERRQSRTPWGRLPKTRGEHRHH